MAKIGNIELKSPCILAPLAGVSDLPYRLMYRKFGCEMAFVEMISIHALLHDNNKTMKLLTRHPDDIPLGVQLLGRDPELIVESIEKILPLGFEILDFNAACPVKKVVRRGEGAALMKELEVLEALLRILVKHSSVPVTVKFRSGWDSESINVREAALRAEDAGVAAIFIHGRTRTQQYRGNVDYTPIREAKEAVKIPVFGSGDVLSAVQAKRMMDETGCDGVTMARGSMGNPWIFPETAQYLRTGTLPPKPTVDEIVRVMHEHLDMYDDYYEPHNTFIIYRKLFMWYTKGIPGAKPLRVKAVRAESTAELHDIINEIPKHAITLDTEITTG
jgi:tRNA-dihydrouridine synthase B